MALACLLIEEDRAGRTDVLKLFRSRGGQPSRHKETHARLAGGGVDGRKLNACN